MLEKLHQDLCLNEEYQIRRSPKQKQLFLDYVDNHMSSRGFECQIERRQAFKKITNIVYGDPKKADIILMAHFDTPKNMAWMMPLVKFIGATGSGAIVGSFLLGIAIGLLIVKIDIFMYLLSPLKWFIRLLRSVSQWANTSILAMTDNAFIESISSVLFSYLPIIGSYAILAIGYLMLRHLFRDNKKNFNDNTSGCIALLNIAHEISENHLHLRDKICFVFTDREEDMLLGTYKFRSYLKKNISKEEYKRKILINFDCVGGVEEEISIFTNSKRGLDLARNISNGRKVTFHKTIKIYKTLFIAGDSIAYVSMPSVTLNTTTKAILNPFSRSILKIHTNKDCVLDTNKIGEHCTMTLDFLSKYNAV